MILAEIIFEKEGSMKRMSLVKSPAVELGYLKLSQEKPLLMATDEEAQELVGVALIPNKRYYRTKEFFGGEEDGYIYFTKETVKQVAMDFLKTADNAVNIEHEIDVEGEKVLLTQSWFVETENDKIYDLGFSKEQVPFGTWCLGEHIPDKSLWEAVKLNTNGYSIEGKFSTRVVADNILLKQELTEDQIVDAVVEVVKNNFN